MIKFLFTFFLLFNYIGVPDSKDSFKYFSTCSHGDQASTQYLFGSDSVVLSVGFSEKLRSKVKREGTWKLVYNNSALDTLETKVYKLSQILGLKILIPKNNNNRIDTVSIRSCVQNDFEIKEVVAAGIPFEVAKPVYYDAIKKCSCDTGLLIEMPRESVHEEYFQEDHGKRNSLKQTSLIYVIEK